MQTRLPKVRVTRNTTFLKLLGSLAALGLVLGVVQAAQGPSKASATTIQDTPTVPTNPILPSNLVAWYQLNGYVPYGGTIPDSSGNGHDATVVGNDYGPNGIPAQSSDSAQYNNTVWCGAGGQWIKLPYNMLAGLTSITITANVGDPTPLPQYYNSDDLWKFWDQDSTGHIHGYLYATDMPTLRAGMSLTDSTGEQTATSTLNLPRPGAMHRVTQTYDSATHIETLYLDGTQIAQNTSVTINPGQINGGSTSNNYLGTGDGQYHGCFNDVRIYNTALTADQVASLPSNQATANADAANLTLPGLSNVQGNLTLPTTLADGAQVSWNSSNPVVIDNSGAVTRQATNTPVTLTATVHVADVQAQAQLTATVIASPVLQVQADIRSLTVPHLSNVQANLNLPTTLPDGTQVSWVSSNPAIIDNTGVVTRPVTNTVVILTATLRVGDVQAQRAFTATVSGTPLLHAQADAANLTVDGLSNATGFLNLPTTLPDGAQVSWVSSNPAVIDNSGAVNHPAANTTVTLTATVQLAGAQAQRQFTAFVGGTPLVYARKDAANLNIDLSHVMANVTLPTTLSDGAQVSWVSSNPSVIDNTGVVARQAGDTTLTMTATIQVGVAQVTRQYTATVIASPLLRAQADASNLTVPSLNNVIANLDLPTVLADGALVSWASSNPNLIDSSGVVHRQSIYNTTVTLTATVQATDGQTQGVAHAQFTATVMPSPYLQAQTDAASLTLPTDLNNVTGNLNLPTTLADGAHVSWASSNPAVLDSSGVVHRQYANTTLTLTATVQTTDGQTQAQARAQLSATVIASPLAGYLFVYFTGETAQGQSLYIALSNGNDIRHYTPINNGNPVLTSHFGTGGLRDATIVRSPDGNTFYLLATDLEYPDPNGRITNWTQAAQWGSRYLEVWKSHNLVDWTQQSHTLVSPATAGDTWAPDATWDPAINQYVVLWSTESFAATDPGHTAVNGNYNRIMYSTTSDFVTFSTPQVWDDPGGNRIDATVTTATDPTTGVTTYYRFTKAQNPLPSLPGYCNQEDILEESSTNLLTLTTSSSEGWTPVARCIYQNATGRNDAEGPIIVQSNPGDVNNVNGQQAYYLYVDESPAVGYVPMVSTSLSNPNWQAVPASGYTNPIASTPTKSTRHGEILPITAAEMAQLGAGPTTRGVPANSTMLNYNFAENGGTVAHDTTGNGLDATAIGGLTLGNGMATFNGTDAYLLLPNNLLAGQNSVTIDADVKVDPSQTGNYMLYGLGSTSYPDGSTDKSAGQGNGYVFATGGPSLRGAITPSDWTHELSASAGTALPTGQWERVTYVINYNQYAPTNQLTTAIYLNGVLQGSNARTVTLSSAPGQINSGWSTDDYIGRSLFSADSYLKGQMKSFTMYNYALSASQVAALGAP